MSDFLKPEDYLEPRCLLCEEPYGVAVNNAAVRSVPQQRIIEKMDEYMGRRDYAGAERHLLYWLEEAKLGQDLRGELMLRNELTGHYRKTGEKEKSLANAEAALSLLDRLDFGGTVSAGTTCVNAATAYNAFGENERALSLFERARKIYEGAPASSADGRAEQAPAGGNSDASGNAAADGRAEQAPAGGNSAASGSAAADGARAPGSGTAPELLGGLYNNMALVCAALGRFDEASELFGKAMDVMGRAHAGFLEQAITCLNMADTALRRDGAEKSEAEIFPLLDRAYALLTEGIDPGTGAPDPGSLSYGSGAPDPGYYAFVCEKCAPTFSYFGYFLAAKELMRRAEAIYKRG